jgi:hypothetical protein
VKYACWDGNESDSFVVVEGQTFRKNVEVEVEDEVAERLSERSDFTIRDEPSAGNTEDQVSPDLPESEASEETVPEETGGPGGSGGPTPGAEGTGPPGSSKGTLP